TDRGNVAGTLRVPSAKTAVNGTLIFHGSTEPHHRLITASPPYRHLGRGDLRGRRRLVAAVPGHRRISRHHARPSPNQHGRPNANDETVARTVHDWVIKPKMRTVKGVAEINGWGGYERQYQVRISPQLLIKHGLTFDEVVRAVEENNQNVGGGMVREGTQAV